MSTVSSALMTAEEFFEWANRPENAQARMHVHRGRVFPLSPPSPVRLAVTSLLSDYVIRRGKGEVAWQAEGVVFDRDPLTVFMPDVMLFHQPGDHDPFPPRFTTAIPTLMVEVIEPWWSGATLDRAWDAIRRGVGEVWHLIPDERSLIRHQPNRNPKVFNESDDLTGNGVLPDFRCKVADLFTLPGQQPPPAS